MYMPQVIFGVATVAKGSGYILVYQPKHIPQTGQYY